MDAATVPATDPIPPITGTARIAMDRAGSNWSGETLCQASAHSTPAMPTTQPLTAKAVSLTVVGLMAMAALVGSESRTAIMVRPGLERRMAPAIRATATRTTTQVQ